jgi:hypothetical protein
MFNVANRPERLSIAQIHGLADALRSNPTLDGRTATAIADALESVARERACRAARLQRQFGLRDSTSVRRVAEWAITNF